MRLLLEKGANPNPQLKMTAPLRATGNDRGLDPMLAPGTTPLIRAAKAMDVESMKALLEHGADVRCPTAKHDGHARRLWHGLDGRDTRGYYPTSMCRIAPSPRSKYCCSTAVQLNGRAGRQQQAPMHGAALWGWDKVAAFLIGKGR